jgi:hypothetical protein
MQIGLKFKGLEKRILNTHFVTNMPLSHENSITQGKLETFTFPIVSR